MLTLVLYGAAGKMGTRISGALRGNPEYEVLHVEATPSAEARLRERGFTPVTGDEAAKTADVVVLAVPDVALGRVSHQVVPLMKPGALLMCLDPAAPWGGELAERADIGYFVVHPCHPPIINDETSPEARMDFFGGIAKQNIVCALMRGPETDYACGEKISRDMFAPVMMSHRITIEQMAMLEPALSETMVLTCMVVIKEALEEAVARGVPAQAARDFVLGHMNVDVGILFGYLNARVSDGAAMAVERARTCVFQPDWRKVFDTENVYAEVKAITRGISGKS